MHIYGVIETDCELGHGVGRLRKYVENASNGMMTDKEKGYKVVHAVCFRYCFKSLSVEKWLYRSEGVL